MTIEMVAYSKEEQLLLQAAHPRLDLLDSDRLRDLCTHTLNWHYILQMASRHGLAPLLYWNLRSVGVDGINQHAASQLERAFRHSGERNLFQWGELLRVLKTFLESEIDVLPLKGPVIAKTLYPHPALRPYGDLDLLVQRDAVPRALIVLAEEGYRLCVAHRREQWIRQRFFNHHVLHNAKRGTVVELHWALMPPYFAPPSISEAIWRQIETISLDSEEVLSMRPEAMLLFLCQHGARHAWNTLLPVCDVAALIHHTPALQWDALLHEAHRNSVDRMLLLGLLLANELLDADLPPHILRCIEADRALGAISSKLSRQLFLKGESEQGFKGKFSRAKFQLQIQQRTKAKLRFCFYRALLALG